MGAISLSDELAPWGVGPTAADETIDLEILHGGQREQVHLAVRLALAELPTKDAVLTAIGRAGRRADCHR
jgi:hypothetical protein